MLLNQEESCMTAYGRHAGRFVKDAGPTCFLAKLDCQIEFLGADVCTGGHTHVKIVTCVVYQW